MRSVSGNGTNRRTADKGPGSKIASETETYVTGYAKEIYMYIEIEIEIYMYMYMYTYCTC